jgi:transposase-like protein
MSRVEVLSSPERRRRWSAEQKRSIVAEAFALGSSVCEVARRVDVVPGQIYRWRRDLRTAAAGFAEVVVAPGPDERTVAGPPAPEIELGRHIRVRIAATVSKELASAIIKALCGTMIPLPTGVRVWIAAGHTDMRRGMQSLALQVQEALKRDPHAGDLYVFRGRSGSLMKILWHDGVGMSLYAKRLERGRFIWPSDTAGVVSIPLSTVTAIH